MSSKEIQIIDSTNDKNELSTISSNNLLVNNEFTDIETVIDDDITEINELYNLVNTNLKDQITAMSDNQQPNQPMRLGSMRPPAKKVSPVYISSQVSNLCAMKSTKLQLLKEKARLRESKLDREIKLHLALNKNNLGNDSDEITEKDVLTYLIKNSSSKIETTMTGDDNIIEGEFIDLELEETLKEFESEENTPIISEVENIGTLESEDTMEIDGDTIRLIFDSEDNKCYLFHSDKNEIIREMLDEEVNLELMDDTDDIIIDTISNTIVEVIQ